MRAHGLSCDNLRSIQIVTADGMVRTASRDEHPEGHLDDKATGPAEEQRQGEVAGDQVGVDGQAQQTQAVVQVVVPQLGVPLKQALAAPDVIDEDVQLARVTIDPVHQLGDFGGLQVVGRDGRRGAADRAHQFGRLLDRLRPPVLGPVLAGGAPGDVHVRSSSAQLNRDPAPGAASATSDQRHLAVKAALHGAASQTPLAAVARA